MANISYRARFFDANKQFQSKARSCRMASDTAKMFGCPVCGFRVSPGEDACPRCGNEFNTSTRFECPFCGELVEPGAKMCPSCHVNYADFKEKTEARGGDDSIDSLLLEIIKLESQSVKSEEKKLSCPICSWMLEGTESMCPKCGKSFVQDVTFQCPVCGSLVNAQAVRCSECGSVFEEESVRERAEAHAEASSALDEIMFAASSTPQGREHAETAPESRVEERRPPAMKSKVSSIFGKIAEVVREEPRRREIEPEIASQPEPEPEPAPARAPVPEPIPEPVPEPPVVEQPKPEPVAEPEQGPATDDEQPKAASPSRKSRQRKLKAKPKQ